MTEEHAEEKPVEEIFCQEPVIALCHRQPCTVCTDAPLAETLEHLRHDGGCVVVLESGAQRQQGARPVGIFTERDYMDKIAPLDAAERETTMKAPIEKFMTSNPRTLLSDESLDVAIQLMTDGGYRHLPLVDGSGNLAGLISTRDIVAHLVEFFPEDVMNLPPKLHQDVKPGAREGG